MCAEPVTPDEGLPALWVWLQDVPECFTRGRAAGRKVAYPVPHALETDELPGIVEDFVRGSQNAVDAGFDGVELHAANG